MTILDLIQQETNLSFRKTSTAGKEHHGPCPWCGDDGKGHKADRFIIWPAEGRYLCRRCGRKGDGIQFVREYKTLSYHQAREYLHLDTSDCRYNNYNRVQQPTTDTTTYNNNEQPLSPPAEQWVEQAWPFLIACQESLWSDGGARALTWLRSRGLSDATIKAAGLGYCDHDQYVEREAWGLTPEVRDNGKAKGLWLPRGVVIPWIVDKELWGLRTRRATGEPKYYWLPGGTANALYNADRVKAGEAAVIVEGEVDALTICQAGYTAVATGSTSAARRTKWIARLATADPVLVAYDNDDAGNKAAAYWLEALPNAKRWRPYWSDANQLQQDGVSVAAWIAAGLGVVIHRQAAPVQPAPDPADLAKAPLPDLLTADLYADLWHRWLTMDELNIVAERYQDLVFEVCENGDRYKLTATYPDGAELWTSPKGRRYIN